MPAGLYSGPALGLHTSAVLVEPGRAAAPDVAVAFRIPEFSSNVVEDAPAIHTSLAWDALERDAFSVRLRWAAGLAVAPLYDRLDPCFCAMQPPPGGDFFEGFSIWVRHPITGGVASCTANTSATSLQSPGSGMPLVARVAPVSHSQVSLAESILHV
jgi:hypothetical protein